MNLENKEQEEEGGEEEGRKKRKNQGKKEEDTEMQKQQEEEQYRYSLIFVLFCFVLFGLQLSVCLWWLQVPLRGLSDT